MEKSVKIGSRLFDAQWRLYSDPWGGFVRELIQNAKDGDGNSGASRIDIDVQNKGDHSIITFADDGPGMSRETLENVYFILGETSKSGAETVGGFGLARMITCFAHRSYTLETRNLFVNGAGASWDIDETENFYQGVKLQIVADRTGHETVLDKFRYYLAKCYFSNCRVYINGTRWTEWTYRNRHARDLTFGALYTNKSASPEILVRVNGTLMYRRYTSAPSQVILEINPEMSRQVLQANRDGLVLKYSDELDSFITELNLDKRSALTRMKNKSTFFKGKGTFTAQRKANTEKRDEVKPVGVATETGTVTSEYDATLTPKHDTSYDTENSFYEGLNLFDVVLEDETTNSAVRKVIDQYDPRNWDLDATPCRSNCNGEYRRGLGRLKLLVMWKAACEKVIEILQEIHPSAPDSIAWGVGWFFSDDGGACHKEDGSLHYLLLNPCDMNGKMRFNVTSKSHICNLLATACHEVVHICESYHDEDYARLLTELTAVCMERMHPILNHMKASKDAITSHFDALVSIVE